MKTTLLVILVSFISLVSYAQSWEPKAELPNSFGVHHPVTWGIGEYGYSVTGTNRDRLPTKEFFKYDSNTDTWEEMPEFPGSERGFSIGTIYKDKGYIGFGASESQYLGDIWSYDPISETWDSLTTCPCEPRIHPSFVIVDDRIFVGLGGGPSGNLNDWWEYDMNDDSWTRHANLPGPVRHHPFQFTVGGHVYTGMGHGNGAIYNDWYKFDIEKNAWEIMNNFPGEARVAGTQFDHAGYGYVLSGDGSDHNFMDTGEFWRYDYITDTWEQLPPHPGTSRWAPGSFVVKDQVHFLAGQNRSQGRLTFDMWAFPLEARPTSTTTGEKEKLEVYPNPAADYIMVEDFENIERVELISIEGALLKSWLEPGEILFIQDIQSGTYLLRFTMKTGEILTRKQTKI